MAQLALHPNHLPHFKDIDPTRIQSTILSILENNRQRVAQLLAQTQSYTWDNLMQPLEELGDELSKIWSPIAHMHNVMESEALRHAYNATLPYLTEYHTELMQNETLYRAIVSIAERTDFQSLTPAQRKIIENDIRDFKLAGVHLNPNKKNRMAELQKQLTAWTTKFSENVLDSTQAWFLSITDENQLAGLPQQALQLAIDNANKRKTPGYVLTLDYPSYSTGMKFLRQRDLRKQLYEAYATRASEIGPYAGKWDNTCVIEKILQIRHEMAQLVGYKNYADYSLATKMAKTTEEVLAFLKNLVSRSKPIAEHEYAEVKTLAKTLDGLEQIEVWDVAYYSEKLQESKFKFTQEDVRPYFPIHRVLQGMFTLIQRIYGMTVRQEDNVEVWHPDVRFFSIHDEQNNLRGGFYIDLFARSHKREGAWMDECRVRRRLNHVDIQLPIAYLTCNFMPPVGDKPALLSHEEVLTLFHEFGHCLHHLLTKVDYPSAAGINGVPWDAVEFPSQFMENFCWEKELLAVMARHYQTDESLPDALYKKMLAAKHFQNGLQMIRQLEFSLFDFMLHCQYTSHQTHQVQTILDEVRQAVAVIHVPAFNRFQHSFSHIFGGSYAAGYYSYKWAEVLSADAYSKFVEEGILNRTIGQSFMENILEVGGVRDPMDSFIAFRGRKPTIDALLKQNGMI